MARWPATPCPSAPPIPYASTAPRGTTWSSPVRGIARTLLEETRRRAGDVGIALIETSARAGEPAEEVYRRLGFREWGRLPNGLRQSWGGVREFDEVYFVLPVLADTELG